MQSFSEENILRFEAGSLYPLLSVVPMATHKVMMHSRSRVCRPTFGPFAISLSFPLKCVMESKSSDQSI